MLMTIRYRNGHRVEAVLLAANREQMRAAIASQHDTIELHKVDARWFTEGGAEIEIESLVALAGIDVLRSCAAVCVRTISAVSGFAAA